MAEVEVVVVALEAPLVVEEVSLYNFNTQFT
jgi:hypothetical protein